MLFSADDQQDKAMTQSEILTAMKTTLADDPPVSINGNFNLHPNCFDSFFNDVFTHSQCREIGISKHDQRGYLTTPVGNYLMERTLGTWYVDFRINASNPKTFVQWWYEVGVSYIQVNPSAVSPNPHKTLYVNSRSCITFYYNGAAIWRFNTSQGGKSTDTSAARFIIGVRGVEDGGDHSHYVLNNQSLFPDFSTITSLPQETLAEKRIPITEKIVFDPFDVKWSITGPTKIAPQNDYNFKSYIDYILKLTIAGSPSTAVPSDDRWKWLYSNLWLSNEGTTSTGPVALMGAAADVSEAIKPVSVKCSGGVWTPTAKGLCHVCNSSLKWGGKFYLNDTVEMDYKEFKEEYRSKCAIQLSGGTGSKALDLPQTINVGGLDIIDPFRYFLNTSYNAVSIADNTTNFPTDKETMTGECKVGRSEVVTETVTLTGHPYYYLISQWFGYYFSVNPGTFGGGSPTDGWIIHIKNARNEMYINTTYSKHTVINKFYSVLPLMNCDMEFKYNGDGSLYISQLIINPSGDPEPYLYYNNPQVYNTTTPVPPNSPCTTIDEYYCFYPGIQTHFPRNGLSGSGPAHLLLLENKIRTTTTKDLITTFPIWTCGLIATNNYRDDWTQGEVK
jgi:hypothetical protein